MSRRAFLTGIASVAAFATRARATETPPELRAAPGSAQLAPSSYPRTPVWTYEGSVPGPTLRIPQGGRLIRRFVNELPQASTIHWHGIRLPNAMDGVPDLTQAPVEPGGDFLYDFAAPDAGTFWYHPHNRSWEQMARGLSGALIVEEPDPPASDRDEVLLLDDWRLTDDASIDESFGNMGDWSHAGRIGNWITVNGDGAWSRPARRGERMRLRLVNTANARVFRLSLDGLEGWTVALDGQPLDTPVATRELVLAPAQRTDLIVDVAAEDGAEALLVSHERDGGYAIAAFAVEGAARDERLPPPAPLAQNPVPALGALEDARPARLVMEGAAMGGMRGAMMGGRRMGMRDLAAAGKVWAFNGVAGMPEAPLLEAARGETVRLTMVNDTAWPHAMHLHGHHFRVLGEGGPGPLRDTHLMGRGETAEIAFVADNPGDWLLHCHMLEHSAGGMMAWLRVI